mgnify:CR=1 FL=1
MKSSPPSVCIWRRRALLWEMLAQLEKLYEKFVPSNVRDFIADRYGVKESAAPRRSEKQASDRD